jgi:hypothetical protein
MPADRLRQTVELMHGGKATFVQFVPVRETFGGNTVWEGVVHVFDLASHVDRNPRLRLVIADRRKHQAPGTLRCCISRPSIAPMLRCWVAILARERDRS